MNRFALAAICLAAPLALAGASVEAQRGVEQGVVADASNERVGTEYMVFETGVEGAAHEHFLRGLALLHNFEYGRAAAAFRESQRADPDFVMAYWGEAMTHNHPLWAEQDRDAAQAILARLDPSREGRLAKTRSAREAAWLDAVETLYGDSGTKFERDFLYLEKMRALHEADPSDIDARAFTGLAILGTSHGGRKIGIYMEAAGVLEPGFMTHERHPGILHYLIHSYDDPVHAPLGERMAERYAVVAPDAGHAQHMISHIYHALGDWKASEKANVLADGVVDRQRAAAGRDPGDCGHYNEWLVYARLQQGKDASDIVSACRTQALAQVAANEGRGRSRLLGSYATIAAWQGVDTGNWPEPLDGIDEGYLYPRMKLAHASVLANMGDADAVMAARSEFRELHAKMNDDTFGGGDFARMMTSWLDRASAQIDAVAMLSKGETEEGMAILEAAAEAESALPVVFGPPAIIKPSWELLGEQHLAAGRYTEAAEAFRKSLAFAPGRKLSLQGLAAAEAAL